MKHRRFAFLLILLALTGSGAAWAQGRWRDLPPEERRQMREQMREHWQQREYRRDGEPPREMLREAPRWRDLPPEDRRRLRDEMREQPGWREAPRDGWGDRSRRRDY